MAMRTDEQTLFCDWAERNDPKYNIWFSAGGNFQSRTAVTAAMLNIAGAEIPAEIVVPHVMRQVTEDDCNPDRVTPIVSGTSLVPDEVLALMFAGRMIEAIPEESDPGHRPRTERGFPPVRGGPGADRCQLRLPRRRGSRPRRRERLGEVDSPRDRQGFVDPDLGTVRIGGKPSRPDSPALARKLGLAMAYQDTSLILAQPVKNNLYLAAPPDQRPPFWRRKKWARKLLAEFDLDLELFPDAPAGFLTLADRQLFEVAKALVSNPKVLLLDEPTTALGPRRGGGASSRGRRLQAARDGCGLRQPPAPRSPRDRRPDHRAPGRSARGTFDARSTTESELVELIVGRPFEAAFPTRSADPARLVKFWWSTVCRVSRSVR